MACGYACRHGPKQGCLATLIDLNKDLVCLPTACDSFSQEWRSTQNAPMQAKLPTIQYAPPMTNQTSAACVSQQWEQFDVGRVMNYY